jgi:hypothetical protein
MHVFLKKSNIKPAALLLLLLGCGATLRAQIDLSTEKPVEGEPVTITLGEPAKEVVVTYRPNSQVIERDTLRADRASTSFTWTPATAGVVALKAGNASRNVSVRFTGISESGIATMIIAGVILFGGATFAFRLLFKDEEEDGTIDLELDHMPDT